MESKDLIIRDTEVGIVNPPEVVLAQAMIAAKALGTVLAEKKKPVIMNGEQYLEFEDWQTVGQFYGYTVRTQDAVQVEIDGVKGAKARAELIYMKTGQIMGGAEAYCMRDEEKWNTRPKYEWQGEGDERKRVKIGDEVVPWFQLASMAQTRAGAKALRNRLAWVVVLAGYRPTPAEEIQDMVDKNTGEIKAQVNTAEHYCPIHKVNFFKKGKMHGYAHKIEGTDEWCNEPTEQPVATKETTESKQTRNTPEQTPIQRLLMWTLSHGKMYDATWVCKQAGVNSTLEITDFPKTYATLKEITGWND